MAETSTFADFSEMSRRAADLVATFLDETLKGNETATLTLAGGSTPSETYRVLAERYDRRIPWERIHILFGDERLVPHDSGDSNYRMAEEALFSRMALPRANIHPIPTDLPAGEAAADYARTVTVVCAAAGRSASGAPGRPPNLDVVLLGMGPDGHTASLFPGSAALDSAELVAAVPAPLLMPRVPRITMTLPLINEARLVLFLVSGSEKTQIVREILTGGKGAARYPASRIQPRGRLVWFLHETA